MSLYFEYPCIMTTNIEIAAAKEEAILKIPKPHREENSSRLGFGIYNFITLYITNNFMSY